MLQIAPKDLHPALFIVPTEPKNTSKCPPRITLITRCRQACGIDNQKALAMITRRKKRCKYVRRLERYIADNMHRKRLLRPLQKYIMHVIKEAEIGPELPTLALLVLSEQAV